VEIGHINLRVRVARLDADVDRNASDCVAIWDRILMQDDALDGPFPHELVRAA
jgi:hypothetical protein